MNRIAVAVCVLATFLVSDVRAEDKPDINKILARRVISPELPLTEVRYFTGARISPMPEVKTVAEWEKHAKRIRENTLKHVVFRGVAAKWRDAKTKVQYLETIEGGKGYRIRKLRYEAIPGLWIPALLYEPTTLTGKVPVVLNVNGHDGKGKVATYKQTRCINQAKRGMLALNVEWFGMGQLRAKNFVHYRLNQIDLCGSSGVAPFYLSMKRGIDVLLSHKHADPKRVAVAGLSGGGWQTIFISSLDKRVTLSNPVAGYSSFRTRTLFGSDLGDSEQTPVDLGVHGDYALLTAIRAPRPSLLTNNAKDNCCFKAEHALPLLVEAAAPIYKLYGKSNALRTHVNHDPGNHNFGLDNRQALYRMFADFFYKGRRLRPDWTKEIPCKEELKTKEQLEVALPADNLDFNQIALKLAKNLPRESAPKDTAKLAAWRKSARKRLNEVLRVKPRELHPILERSETQGGLVIRYWWLRVGGEWTVPGVEISRGRPKGTTIVLADAGRKTTGKTVEALLDRGQRVLAIDPFYFGESKITQRDFLWGLFISAVGKRPLGVQAGQVAGIARWVKKRYGKSPVRVEAVGPRTSLIALCAAGLEPRGIDGVTLNGSYTSLKQVLKENLAVNQYPELFCFGLLEQFDIADLKALVGANKVRSVKH